MWKYATPILIFSAIGAFIIFIVITVIKEFLFGISPAKKKEVVLVPKAEDLSEARTLFIAGVALMRRCEQTSISDSTRITRAEIAVGILAFREYYRITLVRNQELISFMRFDVPSTKTVGEFIKMIEFQVANHRKTQALEAEKTALTKE